MKERTKGKVKGLMKETKRKEGKKLENKMQALNKEKPAGRLYRPKAFRGGAQRIKKKTLKSLSAGLKQC